MSMQPEDALKYLPHKPLVEYRKNELIYSSPPSPRGLFLVMSGRVNVSTKLEDGSEVVLGIVGVNELFGEIALLGEHASRGEQATALEKTVAMCWTTAEIEGHVEHQPKLGLALIQVAVGRCLGFSERLEDLAWEKTSARVANGLLRFIRFGQQQADGSVRIPPLTHELIARYVGTSREMVTSEMNVLRKLGLLRYSRAAIELYPERIHEHLRYQKALNSRGT